MSDKGIRSVIRKSTADIEKRFTDQLERDPTAFVDTHAVIKKLAEKHNIPIKLATNIVMHQYAVSRQLMLDPSFPTIKLKYFGKLFVSKGRRYYDSIIKQASKDKL